VPLSERWSFYRRFLEFVGSINGSFARFLAASAAQREDDWTGAAYCQLLGRDSKSGHLQSSFRSIASLHRIYIDCQLSTIHVGSGFVRRKGFTPEVPKATFVRMQRRTFIPSFLGRLCISAAV
jgi:hypothetical protein